MTIRTACWPSASYVALRPAGTTGAWECFLFPSCWCSTCAGPRMPASLSWRLTFLKILAPACAACHCDVSIRHCLSPPSPWSFVAMLQQAGTSGVLRPSICFTRRSAMRSGLVALAHPTRNSSGSSRSSALNSTVMSGNSLMTLASLSQTLCLVSFHATSFISSRKSEKLKHDSDTFASSSACINAAFTTSSCMSPR